MDLCWWTFVGQVAPLLLLYPLCFKLSAVSISHVCSDNDRMKALYSLSLVFVSFLNLLSLISCVLAQSALLYVQGFL